MHKKFTLFLSVIVLLGLLLAPAGSVAAQAPELSVEGAKSLPLVAPNLIQDPSLENSHGANQFLYWPGQASTNADTPLCRTSNPDCVSAASGPRTGTRWAMFGILDWEDEETISPEVGSLSQTVTFPSCGASLEFYLRIGQAPAGSGSDDVFNVKIDGTTIFTKTAADAAFYPSYTLVTLNVSAYANGAAHTIQFHSITTGQAVIFNLDDISLTRTCLTISGNAGIASATLNYAGTTNGSATANSSGNYSITVPFDWAGTVTPSKLGYTFSPANRTYPNLGTDQTGQNYVATGPTISGNLGAPGVVLSYTDGTAQTATSQANGDYAFTVTGNWSGTVTPSHPCFTFTPANRVYTNVVANQTAQDYTPTPIPAAGCVDINVTIAGNNEGTFSISEQGALTQAPIPGINNGPVKLDSTVSILGGERVIYRVNGVNTSFTEMLGIPNSQLDTTYWLPWYNNVDLDTQLRFANVTNQTASVEVFIGGVEMQGSPFTLLAGESTRQSFAGINNGPVKIVSNQDIVAAERIIYKVRGVNTSFTEMMALPNTQLDTTYWLPWYNNVDLDTQLRFANVHDTQTASVQVYIGGVEMQGSPFTLLPGESTRQSFAGINDGPVKIESNIPIVAAERLIYKANGVNTSFSEMMALPNTQLDSIYWLPRYNNVDLDTQLRLANVSDSQQATVTVTIGGVAQPSFNIPAGDSIRMSFPGINGGLVKIESNIPVVAAERVIYKVRGVNTSFTEMMALPNTQLDSIYWLPWYNNVDLDTHLRFGVP